MFEADSALIEHCETIAEINASNWVQGYKVGLEINESSLLQRAESFAMQSFDPRAVPDIIEVLKENHKMRTKSDSS